jgi:hypothetical protein
MHIQERMKKLHQELAELENELQAFDRVEIAMRRVSKPEPTGTPFKLEVEQKTNGVTTAQDGRGHGKGFFKRQVLDFVVRSGAPVASSHVEAGLLKAGYKPPGKHFDISVYKALNRLVGQGFLKKESIDGRVLFSPAKK